MKALLGITTLVGIAVVLAFGDTAEAAVFRVHTCATPDYGRFLGRALSYTPGAVGWSYEQGGPAAGTADNCDIGGEQVTSAGSEYEQPLV